MAAGADLSGGLEPVAVRLWPPGEAPPVFQVGPGATAAPGTGAGIAPGEGTAQEAEAASGARRASGTLCSGAVPSGGPCPLGVTLSRYCSPYVLFLRPALQLPIYTGFLPLCGIL